MTSTDRALLDALSAERTALAVWLRRLEPAHWGVPSRCEGWTVHDVVAHLASAPGETAWDFLRGMVRHLGRFDAMTAANARAWAAGRGPGELVDQIEASAGSTKTPFGGSIPDSLIDVIVHGQDIARPLEVELQPDTDHVTLALDHALASRWYGARKRFRDVRLAATDHDRTAGEGSKVVEGPVLELLLVATGRLTEVDRLNGTGLERIRA